MRKYLLILLFLLSFPASATEDIAPEHINGALTVNTATARLLFAKGYIFIDVRKLEDFNKEHIPRAKNLAVNSENFTPENLIAIVNKDQAVIFYCNGIHCLGSSKASRKAAEWGWQKILYYREGLPMWKEAGFAVE